MTAAGAPIPVPGLFWEKNSIATAFQAIDAAVNLEMEFFDGRIVKTDALWAVNRLQDWAVIYTWTKARITANILTLERAETKGLLVGERLVGFNVENSNRRVIGGIDVTGRQVVPVFGERIFLMPRPPAKLPVLLC